MLFNKNTASYIINTHFIMEMTKKLKPFDLEAAKAGTPVMTRDGLYRRENGRKAGENCKHRHLGFRYVQSVEYR